ncbi:MAG: N-acetylglucosaminyltransferase [Acidimicrobiales bacterium]|nr:N-acetylglucosaminyltransferase [Acidimicrobiales bacterium]
MRVCYHIQTYRSPDLVTRLARRIRRSSPEAIIHVSHDVRGTPLQRAELHAVPDLHLTVDRGGRGDFNTVDRWLACVRWLGDQRIDCDWLVNLTGQDYPVRPLADVERDLAAGDVDAHLEHFPVLTARSHWPVREGRTRYQYRYRHLADLSERSRRLLRPLTAINRAQPWLRVNVSYGLSAGRRTRRPLPEGWSWYGGSFYGAVSRGSAEHVVAWCDAHDEVVDHLRHTLVPEEVVLQTVLLNAGRWRVRDDSRRYYDFSGSRHGSPRTLTVADVPRALGSGKDFARKFDASEPLDLIDRALDQAPSA